MPDCGCVPRTNYIAGYGLTETHNHAVRGSKTCPTCAEFSTCETNQHRRKAFQGWLAVFLGTNSSSNKGTINE